MKPQTSKDTDELENEDDGEDLFADIGQLWFFYASEFHLRSIPHFLCRFPPPGGSPYSRNAFKTKRAKSQCASCWRAEKRFR